MKSLSFDNYDRYVETLTGKDTLHDTVGIAYQNEIESLLKVPAVNAAGPSVGLLSVPEVQMVLNRFVGDGHFMKRQK